MSDPVQCLTCAKFVQKDEGCVCNKCEGSFHFKCTRLASRETYVKMSFERREKWKCDNCSGNTDPIAIKTINNDIVTLKHENTQLKKQTEALNNKLDQILTLLGTLTFNKSTIESTDIQENTTKLDTITKINNTVHSDDETNKLPETLKEKILRSATVEQKPVLKLPKYLEDVIKDVPRLETDKPWSILKFVNQLYEINELESNYFPEMLKRIAAYQGNSILKNIVTDGDREKIEFQSVANRLISELTTVKTRMYMLSQNVLRPQQYNESFRTYVESISRFAKILSTYDETEIVETIISGVNEKTRIRFQFRNRPRNLSELGLLVSEVEKLEVSAKTDIAKRFYNRSKFFNSFNSGTEGRKRYSYNLENTKNRYGYNNWDDNDGRYREYYNKNKGENNSLIKNQFRNRNYNNVYTGNNNNRRSQSNNNKSDYGVRTEQHQQGKSFRENNPNFTRKFKYEPRTLCPFVPNTTMTQTKQKTKAPDRDFHNPDVSCDQQSQKCTVKIPYQLFDKKFKKTTKN